MAELHDVIVVGGGPAGSATAARLAESGLDVVVIDRARFPRKKCCAEYGSPEVVRELDLLGVLPAIERHLTTRLTGTEVLGTRSGVLSGRFTDASVQPFRRSGLALPRAEFDSTLIAHAESSGARVLQRHRLNGLSAERDGKMCLTIETEGHHLEMTARVVVGADGLRSRVARALGLRTQGRLRRLAFVAHVNGVSGMGSQAELHLNGNRYVGLNPIDSETTNVALVVPAKEAGAVGGEPLAFMRRQLESDPRLRHRIDLGRQVTGVMVTGPFDARCRRSSVDGALLVGDAADFFDPFTGEGILSALIGARLAADSLVEALARPGQVTSSRLTGYRRARRRAFLGKWVLERLIGHAIEHPRLFDRAIANLQRDGLASTMIGVTGGFVPPARILNPITLARLVV